VYDRTWDVSGGRRPAEAKAAAASLRDTFDEVARGELRRGGSKRQEWGAHFIAVTTAGAWVMAPGKDGEDCGVVAALESVIECLGGSRDARAKVKAAMAIPGQPSGLAVLAACSRGGRGSHLWAVAGAAPKDRAHVALTLACADGAWFPALVGGGSGEGARDWRAPWSAWGREPWSLPGQVPGPSPLNVIGGGGNNGGGGGGGSGSGDGCRSGGSRGSAGNSGGGGGGRGVVSDASEATRVLRYCTMVADAQDMLLGLRGGGSGTGIDTSGRVSGGGSGGGGDAGEASTQGRVDITGLLSALIGFSSAHFVAAGWVPLHKLGWRGGDGGDGNDGDDGTRRVAKADVWTGAEAGTGAGAGESLCRHRMTAAEVALVRQTEALIVDLVATRRASVMSELVAAGAADHLSRRLISLLSPDGTLLPNGGGGGEIAALERKARGGGGGGCAGFAAVQALSAGALTAGAGALAAGAVATGRAVSTAAAAAAAVVGPGCVGADSCVHHGASLGNLRDGKGSGAEGIITEESGDGQTKEQETDVETETPAGKDKTQPTVATPAGASAEARMMASALASLLLHNGAALLPEAVRRCGAQDALLRGFLGGATPPHNRPLRATLSTPNP
jgi:hypothetical protein